MRLAQTDKTSALLAFESQLINPWMLYGQLRFQLAVQITFCPFMCPVVNRTGSSLLLGAIRFPSPLTLKTLQTTASEPSVEPGISEVIGASLQT